MNFKNITSTSEINSINQLAKNSKIEELKLKCNLIVKDIIIKRNRKNVIKGKHHYVFLESYLNNLILIYNGKGEFVKVVESTVKGEREGRVVCLELFNKDSEIEKLRRESNVRERGLVKGGYWIDKFQMMI
jgi:uncharacterized protein with PhoU and TrkA domain